MAFFDARMKKSDDTEMKKKPETNRLSYPFELDDFLKAFCDFSVFDGEF